MQRVRDRYSLSLERFEASPSAALVGFTVRHPSLDDTEKLGALLLDAHRGQLDDEGESVDDARRFVVDALRDEPLLYASWVAFAGPRAASVLLVRRWKGQPLVTTVATHPLYTRRGLAARLLERTLGALVAAGEAGLVAVITEGNVASEAGPNPRQGSLGLNLTALCPAPWATGAHSHVPLPARRRRRHREL
jgi:GNAT superfamily N-acetyltransferase